MKTYSIQDKYNTNKVWIVKVYDKGEVFYNQEIEGQKVNSKFQRTTKKWINQILDINLNDRLSDEEQQELLDNEQPGEYMGQDGTLYNFDSYCDESQNIKECYQIEKEIRIEIEEDPLPF